MLNRPVPSPPSTAWDLIENAARGDTAQREAFATLYGEAIRFGLWSRWRNSQHLSSLQDAIQEVFVECFKPAGVLERARRDEGGGFRQYLQGVVQNVALRFESRARTEGRRLPQGDLPAQEPLAPTKLVSELIDRELALRIVREAGQLMADRAETKSPAAVLRVRILRLRFEDGLPIREIARVVAAEPSYVHRHYARARSEFAQVLREVVVRHLPASAASVEEACRHLLQLLE